MASQEPEWIDVTSMEDGGFDVQLDVRARPGSTWEWRHRPLSFTGETQAEWQPGRPPKHTDPA